jgi:hypothetical protein
MEPKNNRIDRSIHTRLPHRVSHFEKNFPQDIYPAMPFGYGLNIQPPAPVQALNNRRINDIKYRTNPLVTKAFNNWGRRDPLPVVINHRPMANPKRLDLNPENTQNWTGGN